MKKHNKVVHVNLMGGIIGWILTNPRKAHDDKIAEKVVISQIGHRNERPVHSQ